MSKRDSNPSPPDLVFDALQLRYQAFEASRPKATTYLILFFSIFFFQDILKNQMLGSEAVEHRTQDREV